MNPSLESKTLDDIFFKTYPILSPWFSEMIESFQKIGIDYQLSGRVISFLKYKEIYSPQFSPIHFFLNEKDIPIFQKTIESLSLVCFDLRLKSPKVLIDGKCSSLYDFYVQSGSDVVMYVTPFERLADGTIVLKEYYHDDELRSRVLETIISNKLSKVVFDSETIFFFNHAIPIVAYEYYCITRNEEEEFLNFLDIRIDSDVLFQIKRLMDSDSILEDSFVTTTPLGWMEEDYLKKSQMILDANSTDPTETQNLRYLQERQIHKVKSGNSDGYSSRYAILVMSLITLIILLSIFLIFYLLL